MGAGESTGFEGVGSPGKGVSMQRRKGFTLIELLVVIAIIAILAAILFPAQTIHLLEVPAENNVTNWAWGCVTDTPEEQTMGITGKAGKYPPIHAGGWNYLFCDGHVKWLRPEATIGTGTLQDPKGMW